MFEFRLSRFRTLKCHEILPGLAGLRVGYGGFPLGIIKYLWRAKQPYNVSVAAEVAACAALENPSYLEVR
jgi:histidinol-phosphate aminotransferase